jgi:hypothetical protein
VTAIAESEAVRQRIRVHAPIEEYNRYIDRWIDDPVYRRMLRHYRDAFIASYPAIEAWLPRPSSRESVTGGSDLICQGHNKPFATVRARTFTISLCAATSGWIGSGSSRSPATASGNWTSGWVCRSGRTLRPWSGRPCDWAIFKALRSRSCDGR